MSKLTEMEILADIVATGSFSAAARLRSLTPSGVSKLVMRLEDRLGILLFTRDSRQVVLTPEGHAYYDGVRKVLDAIEELEAETESARKVAGRLRILCSSSIGTRLIAPHMAEFSALYPDLELEFLVNAQELRNLDGSIDVALYNAELASSSLIARRIATTQHVICASPGYLERHGTPRHPDDLARHRCLNFVWDVVCNSWPVMDRETHARRRISIDAQFTANNSEMILALVRGGCGIARFAQFQVSEEIQEGRLVPVLEDFTPRSDQAIYAVYHSRRYVNSRLRAFLDFIEQKFADSRRDEIARETATSVADPARPHILELVGN